MGKKEILVGSSGVIAVVVTRKIIQSIGIDNIELQTKIFLLFGIIVVYVIKSIREKNRNVRKYSIISSIMFFIFGIFLSAGMIIKEGFVELHYVIRGPLGIFLFIVFVSILIPAYLAYFARRQWSDGLILRHSSKIEKK